mgnify:CR=1
MTRIYTIETDGLRKKKEKKRNSCGYKSTQLGFFWISLKITVVLNVKNIRTYFYLFIKNYI